uniref:NADH-ubiquinone oxidoreductase chain 2 n=1 Tax=Elminae sp. GENSP01 TaxID=1205551 RepID=A0A0S2MMX4_9COLE|nr:NADH deshydrogenase subunit 2 [Elminae sp. GENSP01]
MTKMYKIMFMSSMMMGTMIAISSYSWMGMWLGLEINLLSIIPLLNSNKNIMSTESSLKYFITQVMASTLLLFAIIMMMTKTNSINNLEFEKFPMLILNTALLTKMGAAPFHFWFPEVMEGLSWMNCLIMLTWQKIAPMILMIYNIKMIVFLTMIIFFSMMISGIMGMNQTSLRKIMAYSSINHIAWMISSMMFMETIWLMYFVIYSIITINIILIMNKMNSFYLKQLISLMNLNPTMKMFFILNFLSLGGLPPFLGFFPKWMTIQTMVENKMTFLPFMMVMMTLVTLYFYMRITFSTMLMNTNEINWNNFMNSKKSSNTTIMSLNLISLLGLTLMTILFNWL